MQAEMEHAFIDVHAYLGNEFGRSVPPLVDEHFKPFVESVLKVAIAAKADLMDLKQALLFA